MLLLLVGCPYLPISIEIVERVVHVRVCFPSNERTNANFWDAREFNASMSGEDLR